MPQSVNITKSSTKLFFSNIGITGISFLALIFFTRKLPQDGLGTFFLFQALLGISSIPADLGFRGAVEKRISELDEPGQVLTTGIILQILPILLISIIIFVLSGYINQYLGSNLAMWLIIGILLNNSSEFMLKVLRGELRVGETAVLKFSSKVTWAGGGALLVEFGYGANSLVYSLLLGFSIVLVWGMYKCSIVPQYPSIDHAHSLYDFAKYNIISSVGNQFYNWLDVTVLGLFVPNSHVAAYEIAWRISSILMLVGQSIATSLFPQVSAWDAEGKKEEIERIIPNVLLFTFLFVIPGSFGIFILSSEILSIVFTPEYAIASLALIILATERLFHSAHTVLGRTLNAINHPGLSARAMLISIFINISLNFILIPVLGIEGAAIATAISFIINLILHVFYLSEFLSLRIRFFDLSWITFSSSSMLLVILIIKDFISMNSPIALLVVVILGMIVYTSILTVRKPIRSDIKNGLYKMMD